MSTQNGETAGTETNALPPTARARARQQITQEILTAARTRLRDEGPNQLSLRAVARDVGMVSSAVYRYFSSRDELLTALLVEAYNELGAAAWQADAQVIDREDTLQRWMAVGRSAREWALEHPGDYALLYGTPVPGYAAPSETVGPASRIPLLLARIVSDAYTADPGRAPAPSPTHVSVPVVDAVEGAREILANNGLAAAIPENSDAVMLMIMAWSGLFGTLSFELFGHSAGSVTDNAAYVDHVMFRYADLLGLT
ncbi:TetR/AcrR family transcriptional regulator [Paramicrobacterium chengjingii]|uniref:TetR/AcrR family transcriptional regulator n=1 Tax=Paramicrobacterium chengjingii TaxID=2769067 RepID=UPI001F16F529|nr:TetR/AcrR family transcriptional regulator [Microbacterium chengjingii]